MHTPKYINALEDAQKQSKRVGNPITADTLLLIATTSMLLYEIFSRAEKIWEDLSKEKHDWDAWKKVYKSADSKAKLNKQSVAGQDQFSAAHDALRHAPQFQQANGLTRSAADLDEYFDALSVAVITDKRVLEELVKDNSALTTTNAELSASVNILIKANKKLSRRVGNLRNNNKRTCKDSPATWPKTMCPHWKIKVMHAPNNFYEMEKNATRRPRGWKSRLWLWGTSNIADNKVN